MPTRDGSEVQAPIVRALKAGTFTAIFGGFDPIDATSPLTMNLPTGSALEEGLSVDAFIRAGASTVTVDATPGGQTVNGGGTDPVTAGAGTWIHAQFDGISNWDMVAY